MSPPDTDSSITEAADVQRKSKTRKSLSTILQTNNLDLDTNKSSKPQPKKKLFMSPTTRSASHAASNQQQQQRLRGSEVRSSEVRSEVNLSAPVTPHKAERVVVVCETPEEKSSSSPSSRLSRPAVTPAATSGEGSSSAAENINSSPLNSRASTRRGGAAGTPVILTEVRDVAGSAAAAAGDDVSGHQLNGVSQVSTQQRKRKLSKTDLLVNI